MWRNDIYHSLKEIIDNFGERPGPNSNIIYQGYTSKMLSRQGEIEDFSFKSFNDISEFVRQNLKIYNGGYPILWPDVEFYKEFFSANGWPENYAMSYGHSPDSDNEIISDIWNQDPNSGAAIASCTFVHGYVSHNNYLAYRHNIRRLADAIATKRLGR